MGSHSVVYAGLKLVILLLQPHQRWHFRLATPLSAALGSFDLLGSEEAVLTYTDANLFPGAYRLRREIDFPEIHQHLSEPDTNQGQQASQTVPISGTQPE